MGSLWGYTKFRMGLSLNYNCIGPIYPPSLFMFFVWPFPNLGSALCYLLGFISPNALVIYKIDISSGDEHPGHGREPPSPSGGGEIDTALCGGSVWGVLTESGATDDRQGRQTAGG